MKINHFMGAVLLVAGTTIGAGMLALPVATSFMGFFPSLVLFFLCWSVMLISALFFIDVNSAIPGESNLITMAERTIGRWGQMLSWVVYLLLLYCLIAAYIAASSPLFSEGFAYLTSGREIPIPFAHFCLPLLFGSFIYLGTVGVDLINRVLMVGLVGAYVILVIFIPSHIEGDLLRHVDWKPLMGGIPIVLTSFGYQIIIPTLGTYLEHDKKQLILAVVCGSLIALVINVVWQMMVLGVVPLEGASGLYAAWEKGSSAVGPLSKIVGSPMISIGAYFFSLFAIITSFLGVALSLSDFLYDGLKIKKTWQGRWMVLCFTFFPPLLFVFTYPRGFIVALEYAGAFVAILFIFIPAAMVWNLYKSWRAKIGVVSLMLFAVFVVGVNVWLRCSS
jgi:tyrosine-specific transport protein